MQITKNEIDSAVFGSPVLELHDVDADADFERFESVCCREHAPGYISAKLSVDELDKIQFLEKHGFEFAETQLRLSHRLRGPYAADAAYRFERITGVESAQEVLEIASSAFTTDRFYVDPRLSHSERLSGDRYRRYVLQSLQSEQERVYRLCDAAGKIVAFKTHRVLENGEALMLLGGVRRDCQGVGLGMVSTHYEFNALLGEGVTRFTTHVSLRNLDVVNLEVAGLGYRVRKALVVLRKLYPQAR